MYKCNNCGFIFDEVGIIQINYQEYPGAGFQKAHVSACCNATFEETEE